MGRAVHLARVQGGESVCHGVVRAPLSTCAAPVTSTPRPEEGSQLTMHRKTRVVRGVAAGLLSLGLLTSATGTAAADDTTGPGGLPLPLD